MLNFRWQKYLCAFLILSSLGCAQFYDSPDKKKNDATNPANLNTADTRRVNKKKHNKNPEAAKREYTPAVRQDAQADRRRLKASNQGEGEERREALSDAEKKFQSAENILITYLEASDKDKQWMQKDLTKSIADIDGYAGNCPGYLPYVNTYMKIHLGMQSKPLYDDQFDLGIYKYITERKDLAAVIKDMQKFRSGRPSEYVPISHISSGIFHKDRFDKLKNIVASVVPLEQLKGKTLVDIGGGGGGTAAALTPYVINKEAGTGKVVLVEIEPSLLEFAKFMGKYDKNFTYLELRRCQTNKGVCDPALKAGEADIVCLFDVHNLYDKFDDKVNDRVKIGRGIEYLKKIKAGLKKNGVLLVYDSERFSCSASKIKEMAEKAGLQAQIKSENLDNAVNPLDVNYLVVCRNK